MLPRETAVGYLLACGVVKGLWSLDQLDKPSPGWDEIEKDRVRSAMPRDTRNPHDLRRVPAMRYPDAGTYSKPRNLAREWIAANPEQWAAMEAGEPLESDLQAIGTPATRQAAGVAVSRYDGLQRAGALAPAMEHDAPSGGFPAFPEQIDGPIGFRPEWLAKRQQPA